MKNKCQSLVWQRIAQFISTGLFVQNFIKTFKESETIS